MFLAFAQAFFAGLDKSPGWDILQGYPCLQPVRDSVQSFKCFISCVHELLQIEHPIRAFEDVKYFLSYKDMVTWEKSISNILTRPEKRDADQDALAARAFLHGMANDLVKASASSVKLEPNYQLCMQKMQVDLPSIDVLKFVSELLPQFMEGLRAGRGQSLVKLLKDKSQIPECFDASNQLVDWATKHNAGLYQESLARVLETYLDKMRERPLSLLEVTDFEKVKTLASKARPTLSGDKKQELPEHLRTALVTATVTMMNQAVQEASSLGAAVRSGTGGALL